VEAIHVLQRAEVLRVLYAKDHADFPCRLGLGEIVFTIDAHEGIGVGRDEAVVSAQEPEGGLVGIRPPRPHRRMQHRDPGIAKALEVLVGEGVRVAHPLVAVGADGQQAEHVHHDRLLHQANASRGILGGVANEQGKAAAVDKGRSERGHAQGPYDVAT
jgi:hypothetical protein